MALCALILFAPGIGLFPLLGLTLAAGVAAASVAPLWNRNLRRTPLFTWGMVIAHLGIAVSLAGMASETAFTEETLVAVPVGETVEVGPYSLRFDAVRPISARKSVVWGKSVSVRVDLGGRSITKKKKKNNTQN